MKILPKASKVVIPIRKFTHYALNRESQPNKAAAFDLALGFKLGDEDELIELIRVGLQNFPATAKGDGGYGLRYEVIMDILGKNGKTAKVLTAWIDDAKSGEMRLTSVYIDKVR